MKQLANNIKNQLWRFENLYYIIDSDTNRVKFKLNDAQRKLLKSMSYRNIILKARQLGFSTFILIYLLDVALFYPNTSCGLIADKLDNATKLFSTKILYAYDNLPDGIKNSISIVKRNATELLLSNDSSITVGASLRSTTLNYLHISEFGKIAARNPEKAREIITGALPTLAPGGFVFIESTAEGQDGKFFDMVQNARSKSNRGDHIGELDFKFHFFPWHGNPKYIIDPTHVVISPDNHKYFRELEDQGIILTDAQKAWYVKMQDETVGDDMNREFPSTPEEAFAAAIEGAYYGELMAKTERDGRVRNVPHDPMLAVETWWDLGMSDSMSITFVQRHGSEIRIIDYYENSGEGLSHYARMLREGHRYDYRYSRHIGPHDSAVRELSADGKSRKEVAETLGMRPWEITNRVSVAEGIEMVRNILPRCYFDKVKCERLLKSLKQYRKEWNDKLGTWQSYPRHDWTSHAADSFRTGATAKEIVGGDFNQKIVVPNFGAI